MSSKSNSQFSSKFNTQYSSHSKADRWLKAIGALVVLWIGAKIIGTILSPGTILLAVALWLVIRSHNKRQSQRQAQPTLHFVPVHESTAFYAAPQPPRGYWMPTAAAPAHNSFVIPQPVPSPKMATPNFSAPIIDTRSAAEREIEEYVEQAWPHVKK